MIDTRERLAPEEVLIAIAHELPKRRKSFKYTPKVNRFFRERQGAFPELLGHWKLLDDNSARCSDLTSALAHLRNGGAIFVSQKTPTQYNFTDLGERDYHGTIEPKLSPRDKIQLHILSCQFDRHISTYTEYRI
ncbi:MAG: hypothetical protein WCP89_00575 [archaeon]